jgi:hypothetical protein
MGLAKVHTNLIFFSQKFLYVKKKLYLCTRFENLTYKIMTVNELFKELSTIPEELRDSEVQVSTGYNELDKVNGVGITANISLKEVKLSFY